MILTVQKGVGAWDNKVLCDGREVENASFLAERSAYFLIQVAKTKGRPATSPVETATEPAYEARSKPRKDERKEKRRETIDKDD